MKRALLIIAVIISHTFCFGKTSLSDQQYDFLNWYVLNNPNKLKDLSNVLERFDNFVFDKQHFLKFQLLDESNHHKISLSDQRFFEKQIAENKNVEMLDTTLIKYTDWKVKTRNIIQHPISSIFLTTKIQKYNSRLKIPDSLLSKSSRTDRLLQKLELKSPATTLSLPVFTKNGKIAFINRVYHCEGTCSSGAIEIYTKMGDKWKFIGYLSEWIS